MTSEDEFFRCIFRYGMAARDGIAKENIRILAKVMVGHFLKEEIYSSEFSRHADVISRLSRGAIMACGHYATIWKKHEETHKGRNTDTSKFDIQKATHKEIRKLSKSSEVGEDRFFGFMAECAGLGILRPADGFGMAGYWPTPLLFEIINLSGESEFHLNDEST